MSKSAPVWDLVVIGGGSAGIVAAKTASRFGASVVLIERDRPGGDCLWTGCIPSKALLASASAAANARHAARLGVSVTGVAIDFTAVMRHVRTSIQHIEPVDSVTTLTAEGITVITGTARFVGPGVIDVDGQLVRFRQAVIATGATPALPPIAGLDGFPILTSDNLWDLEALPARLAILGGGSIGCELGQGMSRLGTQVTIIEAAPRILPREDVRAAQIVHEALARDGVIILTGQPATRVYGNDNGSGRLAVGLDEDVHEVSFDRLLVAVGRAPSTGDLGLDTVGVRQDERGLIIVNRALRTSNKRIWAAGDLTGYPQFTHTAGVHGSLAASNAVLGLRRKVDTRAIPRVTFTDPEVAAVGAATGELNPASDIRQLTREHASVDRAVTDDDKSGFACLAVDRKGRILGATIVGPRAGESLAEVTLAVRKGMNTRDLAGTIHPYPTYSDGAWNAAIEDVKLQLERPATRRAMNVLVRIRRARLRWSV